MIPEGQEIGHGLRAVLAALALGAAGLIIYLIFSSGFGRPPHAAMRTPAPAPAPAITRPAAPVRPVAAAAAVPRPPESVIAVISGDFWLTYLPRGLVRTGGGALRDGAEGGWARFGSAGGFVEVRVEHGSVAADWDGYRKRITVLSPRPTTVRGKPAVAGRHPGGGRVIVWLERPGTGAWIRVGDSLGRELLAIAASVKAPVGD
ncbi:hypothetical protein SAMN05444920_11619 [Nonomuraea solani]|uniref:Uncharacterized protein n=1 Tax=Nonomuraea solani TaxID=1144553 RepID=A0A1H6ETL8_9ACTN|nr:hypothetical protein [Nonomuraea solani]SEH00285.1 hypothetical protein SAMN05444920_11619 [Nonomuraea solani]